MNSIRKRLMVSMLIGLGSVWLVSQGFVYQMVKQSTVAVFDSEFGPIEKDTRFYLMQASRGANGEEGSGSRFRPRFAGPSDLLRERRNQNQVEVDPDVDTAGKAKRRMDFYARRATRFSTADSGLYFSVLSEDGSTVLHASPSLDGDELVVRSLPVDGPSYWNAELENGQKVRVFAMRTSVADMEGSRADWGDRFRSGPPPPPLMRPAILLIARERSELDRSLSATVATFLGVGLCGAIIVVVLVNQLLGKGLKPLNALAYRVGSVDEHSLDHRFERGGNPRELIPIVDGLNGLLTRLEQSFARERRFSSDAAHELRTPVAELRALAETALKWPASIKPDHFRNALLISGRMQKTIEGLLQLARIDNRTTRVEIEPVEVATLIAYSWSRYEAVAQDRGIRLESDLEESLLLETNPDLLERVFDNLFSNLVEYAPSDTAASLLAKRDGNGQVYIELSNEAPLLDETQVVHLFERFWRADKSRSEGDHSGLGLSLAASCASAVGLELSAQLSLDKRITFVIRETDRKNKIGIGYGNYVRERDGIRSLASSGR